MSAADRTQYTRRAQDSLKLEATVLLNMVVAVAPAVGT